MNLNQSIYEAMITDPGMKDYFKEIHLDSFCDPKFKEISKTMSLKRALEMKNISKESFIEGYKRFKESSCTDDSYTMSGVLPCPIKIPLLEALEEYLPHCPFPITLDLQSANLGLDFIKNHLENGNFTDFPDIVSSVGMELFFNHSFQENYMGPGKYVANMPFVKEQNHDYVDPQGKYGIIALVPAVFIVDNTYWKGNHPRTWEELLDPSMEDKIGLPHMDLDLMNALYVTIYSKYGMDGIKSLYKNKRKSLHPAQMTGKRQNNTIVPLSIAPYFFASMVSRSKQLSMVWPEDGAIVSPIFFFHKDNDVLHPFIDFLTGETIGKIFSKDGFFPSTNPKVPSELSKDQPLWWVGWDFLHSVNIEKILKDCDSVFEGDHL
ncbi:MAG: ABC transporter substrate-binding protein [Tissierellia bacterium]|nr:ABC transporter substrate-binding protein [Tissierellia bacterium]